MLEAQEGGIVLGGTSSHIPKTSSVAFLKRGLLLDL